MANLIYIPHVDRRLGVKSYRSAIEANNLTLASINSKEAYQLPLSDRSALFLADSVAITKLARREYRIMEKQYGKASIRKQQ